MAIPEGWEFEGVEDGEVVLRLKKDTLPATWEDCLLVVDEVESVDDCAELHEYVMSVEREQNGHEIGQDDRMMVPRGLGNPLTALCQLLVCREAWWRTLEWLPRYDDNEEKHFICVTHRGVETGRACCVPHLLVFPTAETRDKFLETFRDLIEEAKELLL